MDSESLLGLLEIIGFFIVWFGIGVAISFGFTAVIRKLPKLNTLFNLPIVLYPYGYMIAILMVFLTDGKSDGLSAAILVGVFLILHPLVWAMLITNFRTMSVVDSKKLATLNMAVKLAHIPAYIVHFLLGVFGALASVWGIGFFVFAVSIDLITIGISGTFSLATVISLYKQKRISKLLAIVAGILSYIYCVDVIVAIIVKVVSSKKKVE